MISKEVNLFLLNLEKIENWKIDFPKIAQNLNLILKKEDFQPNQFDSLEYDAFSFIEDYHNSWGTYFGPQYSFPDTDGKAIEFPSLNNLTKEHLEYLDKRSDDVTNPVLKNRYSDLVIDFSKHILSNTASFQTYKTNIDSAIEVCNKQLRDAIECKAIIRRTLQLAISRGYKVTNVAQAMIKLESKIAMDEMPGLWGFSFESLILDSVNRKKVNLNNPDKDLLIQELEKNLH